MIHTEVDLDRISTPGGEEREIPAVWLQYCLDATEWQVVDSSDQPASLDEPPPYFRPGARHPVTVQVIYFDSSPVEPRDNPRWMPNEWEHEEDESC
jgi:hypothetical protein